MAARLAAFVAREEALAAERVRATGLHRLAGGASREIWSADLAIDRDGAVELLPLVVRKDPAGRVGDGGDRGVELGVLRAAWAGGVPVPKPRWGTNDTATLGAPFFLMDRITGETLPRRLLREDAYAKTRAGMAAELGAILAKIHALDLASPDLAALARPPADRSPAQSELERVASGISIIRGWRLREATWVPAVAKVGASRRRLRSSSWRFNDPQREEAPMERYIGMDVHDSPRAPRWR